MLVATAVASVVLLSVGAGGSAGGVKAFYPVADAYVRSDRAGNFGKEASLLVDGSPAANAYLRFRVRVPVGETVTRASLKVFTTQASGSGFTVHRVRDNSWGEATITRSNAPPIGKQVGGSGSYRGGRYVSADVTSLVWRSGTVSMALKRSSRASSLYNSREAASHRPHLIVDTASAQPRPPRQTVVYALGDGADGSLASRALADYVKAQNPDRFFYLGDVYATGTAAEFDSNYEPLYGSLAAKTDPVIGNHEYGNRAIGYYPYWQSKRGWTEEQAKHRSYVDAASGWQIIAYSSENDMVVEGAWVAAQIAKHAGTCRIVMAHRGRHAVVDSVHSDNTNQEPVWSAIVNRAAINLVGHNHLYGRLAPINGVNVFVSGAGGYTLSSLGAQHHTLAASVTKIATATRLVLRRGSADFRQVDKNGTVYDTGSIGCVPGS